MIQAVLRFQMFDLRTTCTFVHYKFSPPTRLSYAKFGLASTADRQTFQAIVQWRCLSANPTLQSLCGLSNINICAH